MCIRDSPFFEGQGQWISTSVYQFVPAVPLAAATTFNVTVAPLTAVDGSAMSEPFTFSFTTSTPIVLGAKPVGILVPPDEPVVVTFSQPMDRASTQPSDGAEDVDPNNPITVIFNRPVVPLTGVEEQAGLPQPLDFDPFFEGQGQWLSLIHISEPTRPY